MFNALIVYGCLKKRKQSNDLIIRSKGKNTETLYQYRVEYFFMLVLTSRFGTACGHNQLKVPPKKLGGIMKIFITENSTVIFSVKKSDHFIIFRLSFVDAKPLLSGGWNKGGFGGNMKLSKSKLWFLFLREIRESIIRDDLILMD